VKYLIHFWISKILLKFKQDYEFFLDPVSISFFSSKYIFNIFPKKKAWKFFSRQNNNNSLNPYKKTIFVNLILRLLTGAKYFEIDS